MKTSIDKFKVDKSIINNTRKEERLKVFNEKLETLTIPKRLEKYIISHASCMVNGNNVYYDLNDSITISLFERHDLVNQAIYAHWMSEYTDNEQGIFWEVGDYIIWGEDKLLYLTGKDDEYFRATNTLEETSAFLLDEIYNLTNISYLYRIKEYEKNSNMVIDHDLKVCYYENPGWKLSFGVCRILDIKEDLQTLHTMKTPKKEQITIDKDLYEKLLNQRGNL